MAEDFNLATSLGYGRHEGLDPSIDIDQGGVPGPPSIKSIEPLSKKRINRAFSAFPRYSRVPAAPSPDHPCGGYTPSHPVNMDGWGGGDAELRVMASYLARGFISDAGAAAGRETGLAFINPIRCK